MRVLRYVLLMVIQLQHEDDDEEWSVVTKKNKAAVTRGRKDLGGE
jgi:hypothetical protein